MINYHVVGDANRVDVTLVDNTSREGRLVGIAPDKDIAVLQIDAPPESMPAIPLGESENLLVGMMPCVTNWIGHHIDETVSLKVMWNRKRLEVNVQLEEVE